MRLSYLLFERTELAGGLFQRLAEASVLLDEFLHGAAHTRRGLQAVILLLLQKGEVLTGLLEFLTCILRLQAVLFRIGSKLVRKILFNGGKLLFDILTVQKSDIQLREAVFKDFCRVSASALAASSFPVRSFFVSASSRCRELSRSFRAFALSALRAFISWR